MSLPLEGVKVLDLSRYLPGPFCTQILADFGAEVIKVEDPQGGDLGRNIPPFVGEESARFFTVNRNKKSVTLDLRQAEGKEVFKKLVAVSDVVLDQFRPGVMDRLGLGYEVLKQINDRLIYCALTGYGLSGPMRDAAGHDQNYLSIAGVTELTGTYPGTPAMSAVQIADIAGGTLYAVIGILLALASRERSGKGQLVDVAMTDGSLSLLAYTIGEWSGWGRLPERGNDMLTGGYACYKVYATKDERFVTLGAIEGKFWAEFCEKVGRTEYIKEQWNTKRQPAIIEDLKGIFREKTRDEWVEFFKDNDICFTPVLTLEEVVEHPQILAREMVLKLTNVNNSGKDIVLTGIPVKLSDTPGEIKLTFPKLGEQNQEILSALGYSQEEIEEFRRKRVI